MKIELRNLKHIERMSRETFCFDADVYVDGVHEGRASNDGGGGMTRIEPRALEEKLSAYAKTLPKKTADMGNGTSFTYQPDADNLIGDLVTDALIERDLKKALSTRILFTRAGSKDVFRTKASTTAGIKAALAQPAQLASLGADKVLNTLPFGEALALYRGTAR